MVAECIDCRLLNPLNVSAVAIPERLRLPLIVTSPPKVAEPPKAAAPPNVDTPDKLILLSILMSPEMTASPKTLSVV